MAHFFLCPKRNLNSPGISPSVNFKPLKHIHKSSLFCPQRPLSLSEVGRQAAHTALRSGEFNVAIGKKFAKILREKALSPILKINVNFRCSDLSGEISGLLQTGSSYLSNNTVVNLNKIKKRSNPVDKCFG